MKHISWVFIVAAGLSGTAFAQLPFDRILGAQGESQNWPTYNGSLKSMHHSTLDQINPSNAANLDLKWVYQAQALDKFETTPLVVDGIMYITEPPSNVAAIDARTGRPFWVFQHPLPEKTSYECCGNVNRGLAMLGDTLYMGTVDAYLVAIDAATGRKKWETKVAEYNNGYTITVAPLVVKNLVIVGPAGGEAGISGFLAAYDGKTGKEVWRFHTIPQPGDANFGTWKGDSWKTGGASIWVTGSYDAESNLIYWGIGNPGPDWNASSRLGTNLYSDCVVAIDADTGKLKWYYQFTEGDEWDFDAVQVPVLADIKWNGAPRKVILWGNRNGFFYVLDRTNGQFLLGKPFVKETWAKGINDAGKPVRVEGKSPSATGTDVYPGVQGGTNWYAPSFSPRTGLFYLTAWEDYHSSFFNWEQEYEAGKAYTSGMVRSPLPIMRRLPFIKWGREWGYGVVRALDPATGEKVWEYKMVDTSEGGILTTGSDLLFSGNREGYFFVLDAKTGKELWKRYLGLTVAASPITYTVDGVQYVTIAAGHALFSFGLGGTAGR
jgi:alcohol dehydrogenase (cytochrome c)